MKQNLQTWCRKKLKDLIIWAAGEQLLAQAKQDGWAAGRTSALRVCDELRSQLKALQMLDVQFNGSGKIIIAAHVGGQDIVQIIDVPVHCSLEEWRRRSYEIKQRYGVEIRMCDVPSGYAKQAFAYAPQPLRK